MNTKQVVEFERHDAIALLRINRPEIHNAVNEAVMEHLENVQEEIYSDSSIRIIILTSAGRESFCSGGDLKHFASLKTREDALNMSRRMQAILNKFWQGDRVVIAAVNGKALGGGCEILTASHFRIAAEHATFSFRQAVIQRCVFDLQLYYM